MRDHELELIAALVEGRLEDETAARALIASSPEHQEEYEAQRLAYSTLQELGTARLTDLERSSLHREVWSGVRPRSTSGRMPWYARWVPAAAAILVTAGVAAVLLQSVGGQDSGGGAESAQGTVTSTMAAATRGDGDDTSTDGGEPASPTMTQAGAGEQTIPPPDEELALFYSAEAAMLRAGDFSGELEPADETPSISETEIASCVAAAGLTGFRVVATLKDGPEIATASTTTTMTGEPAPELALAVPEDAALATAPVAFVDLDSCELVYTDE